MLNVSIAQKIINRIITLKVCHMVSLTVDSVTLLSDGPKNTSVSVRPSMEVDAGSNITLMCSSHANPPVKNYTWFKKEENEDIMDVGHQPVFVSGGGGQFLCRATNKHGSQNSSVVTVTVKRELFHKFRYYEGPFSLISPLQQVNMDQVFHLVFFNFLILREYKILIMFVTYLTLSISFTNLTSFFFCTEYLTEASFNRAVFIIPTVAVLLIVTAVIVVWR